MNQEALTDEELVALKGFIRQAGYSPDNWRGRHSSVFVTGLIVDLRAAQDRIKELEQNQITHEYDEETGYCLCTCCSHGV